MCTVTSNTITELTHIACPYYLPPNQQVIYVIRPTQYLPGETNMVFHSLTSAST